MQNAQLQKWQHSSWWHIHHFLAPRRQLSGARNSDTFSRQMIPAEKKRWIPILRVLRMTTFIAAVLEFRLLKKIQKSNSIFIFVYKQTSSAIVCSDWPITVQLCSWFSAQNGMYYLTPVSCTWNWPVCSSLSNSIQWIVTKVISQNIATN